MFAFVLLELRPISLFLSRLVAAISQIAPNIIREDREREGKGGRKTALERETLGADKWAKRVSPEPFSP